MSIKSDIATLSVVAEALGFAISFQADAHHGFNEDHQPLVWTVYIVRGECFTGTHIDVVKAWNEAYLASNHPFAKGDVETLVA